MTTTQDWLERDEFEKGALQVAQAAALETRPGMTAREVFAKVLPHLPAYGESEQRKALADQLMVISAVLLRVGKHLRGKEEPRDAADLVREVNDSSVDAALPPSRFRLSYETDTPVQNEVVTLLQTYMAESSYAVELLMSGEKTCAEAAQFAASRMAPAIRQLALRREIPVSEALAFVTSPGRLTTALAEQLIDALEDLLGVQTPGEETA